MRKYFLSGLFLFLAAFMSSAQARPTIRIVNNTGYSIWFIYVSPSNSDKWGEDLLGNDILRRGDFSYRLPQPLNRQNIYDIMLIDDEGDEYVKWDVRITDNARIVFTLNDLIYDDNSSTQQSAQRPPQHSSTQQSAQRPPQQTTQQPSPQPTPQPSSTATASSQAGDNAVRAAIVNAAQRYLGARYVLGAQTPPTKFDCSGLVGQAYKDAANMILPRTSAEIWARGKRINRSQLAPGDIIVYSENGRTPSHVAIYVNNTDMIHSVSIGNPTGVIRSKQTDCTWPRKEIGYVTFIGVTAAVSRNYSQALAVTDLSVEINRTLSRFTEVLPVQAGSGLSFAITNSTGSEGQFDLYFYKVGTSRANGDTEFLWIPEREIEESKVFLCEEAGQYRLEIVRRVDNRTLLEYTYNVER